MKNLKPESAGLSIKEKILKFIRGLNGFSVIKNDLDLKSLKIDDVYGFNLLQPLLCNHPYLPFNGGALRPLGIAYLLNEIIINNRENILEFGSGISTIIMARLIKQNNLKAKITSVEHHEEWILQLEKILENEGLRQHVSFIHADLMQSKQIENCFWYDESTLTDHLGNMNFDFVIVDGPPANLPENDFSRFPIIDFIQNRLSKNFCFFLDDANRAGETKLAEDFKKAFPESQSSFISKTFYVSYSNLSFNPIPLHYILK